MDDQPLTLRRLSYLLRNQRYGYADEIELQTGVQEVLERLGLVVDREVRLDEHSRIDIMTGLPQPGADPIPVGIEVKIQGKPQDVRRQVQRYAAFDRIGALMLVTPIARHQRAVLPHATSVLPGRGNPAGSGWLMGTTPFEIALINRGML
jgi:hypothetical protein